MLNAGGVLWSLVWSHGTTESVVPAMQQLVYANHTTTTFLRGGIRIYMYMYIMYQPLVLAQSTMVLARRYQACLIPPWFQTALQDRSWRKEIHGQVNIALQFVDRQRSVSIRVDILAAQKMCIPAQKFGLSCELVAIVFCFHCALSFKCSVKLD